MTTSDWEKIVFEIEPDTPVLISHTRNETDFKVKFGKYIAEFYFGVTCCEDYGVKIDKLGLDYNSSTDYFDEIEICKTESCNLTYDNNEDVFKLHFNDYVLIFYNYHNGYYPHDFFIKDGENQIFYSAL
jgi:hypothetical protein